MPFFDDLPESTEALDVAIPTTALCLRIPHLGVMELVVHRDDETEEDFVFLFEALDDAYEYALMAKDALGLQPEIRRVRLRDLHFRAGRFKPAVGEPLDLPLRH